LVQHEALLEVRSLWLYETCRLNAGEGGREGVFSHGLPTAVGIAVIDLSQIFRGKQIEYGAFEH
jgi:hypothetical protein